MRKIVQVSCAVVGFLASGCGRTALPTTPTSLAAPPSPVAITLEAESGSGDGDLMQRPRASGVQTVHLAPGQRRRWTFTVQAAAHHAVLVTYSNDNPGETEVLRVELDGIGLGSFRAQDTGDEGEGWNIFVTELAGTSMLAPGVHAVTVESSGGDGCIEIDFITVRPQN